MTQLTKPTWIADRVLIVVVGDVGVGGSAAPGKLQHHHARRSYGFAQLIHICGDHPQVLCYDGDIPQLLQCTRDMCVLSAPWHRFADVESRQYTFTLNYAPCDWQLHVQFPKHADSCVSLGLNSSGNAVIQRLTHVIQGFEEADARSLLPDPTHGSVSLGIHRPVTCTMS